MERLIHLVDKKTQMETTLTSTELETNTSYAQILEEIHNLLSTLKNAPQEQLQAMDFAKKREKNLVCHNRFNHNK